MRAPRCWADKTLDGRCSAIRCLGRIRGSETTDEHPRWPRPTRWRAWTVSSLAQVSPRPCARLLRLESDKATTITRRARRREDVLTARLALDQDGMVWRRRSSITARSPTGRSQCWSLKRRSAARGPITACTLALRATTSMAPTSTPTSPWTHRPSVSIRTSTSRHPSSTGTSKRTPTTLASPHSCACRRGSWWPSIETRPKADGC